MAILETELRSSTPARILDAAFEAIRDFGLSRVTVEDVAQRAGLSRQTVYRYFPSKDELIVALVSREEEKLLDGARAVFIAHDDLERAIYEADLFVLRRAREHPLLDRLLSTDESAILPYLTTRSGPLIARAREALVELSAPRLPGVDREYLLSITDAAVRAMVSYILTPSEAPPEAIAATMARVMAAALKEASS